MKRGASRHEWNELIIKESELSYLINKKYSYIASNSLEKFLFQESLGTDIVRYLNNNFSKEEHGFQLRSFIQKIINSYESMYLKGYFHLDIKPDNIMKNGKDFLFIDFGQSTRIQNVVSGYFGTSSYMPPESAPYTAGWKTVHSLAVDLFSLGVTLLVMIKYSEPERLFLTVQGEQVRIYNYMNTRIYYDAYCNGEDYYKIHDAVLEELVCSFLDIDPEKRMAFWAGPRRVELTRSLVPEGAAAEIAE